MTNMYPRGNIADVSSEMKVVVNNMGRRITVPDFEITNRLARLLNELDGRVDRAALEHWGIESPAELVVRDQAELTLLKGYREEMRQKEKKSIQRAIRKHSLR